MLNTQVSESKESAACLTGLVLAGGKSSRMGSDKGLMLFRNRPLVTFALDALIPFCKEILISTNNEDYSKFGFPLVKDIHKGIGPMGGLHGGLKASTCDHLLVLSCDMPFVDGEVIEKLLSARNNFDAVVMGFQNEIIPVCACYSKSILPVLEKHIARQHFKMKLFINELKNKVIWLDDDDGTRKVFNINSLDDIDAHYK
jgi:molybdenum cofactor guanylyltransferase